MAKQDLTQLTVSALLALAGKEPSLIGDITAEIERRSQLQDVVTIGYNCGGGLMATCGSRCLGNMPVDLARAIVGSGDGDESAKKLRDAIRVELARTPDEVKKIIADKVQAKAAKELAKLTAKAEKLS